MLKFLRERKRLAVVACLAALYLGSYLVPRLFGPILVSRTKHILGSSARYSLLIPSGAMEIRTRKSAKTGMELPPWAAVVLDVFYVPICAIDKRLTTRWVTFSE